MTSPGKLEVQSFMPLVSFLMSTGGRQWNSACEKSMALGCSLVERFQGAGDGMGGWVGWGMGGGWAMGRVEAAASRRLVGP